MTPPIGLLMTRREVQSQGENLAVQFLQAIPLDVALEGCLGQVYNLLLDLLLRETRFDGDEFGRAKQSIDVPLHLS